MPRAVLKPDLCLTNDGDADGGDGGCGDASHAGGGSRYASAGRKPAWPRKRRPRQKGRRRAGISTWAFSGSSGLSFRKLKGRAPAKADVLVVQVCRSHTVMVMMVVVMFVMVMIAIGGGRRSRESQSRYEHSCCNKGFQHGRFLFLPQKSLWVSHYRPARVNAN